MTHYTTHYAENSTLFGVRVGRSLFLLLTSILVKSLSRFILVNVFKLIYLSEYFYVVFLIPLSTVQLYMCESIADE